MKYVRYNLICYAQCPSVMCVPIYTTNYLGTHMRFDFDAERYIIGKKFGLF